MTKLPNYVLRQAFDAPRELVWQAWTDPKLLPRWYGPNVNTIIHQLEPKHGGLWLTEMQWGDNSHYQRAKYIEVIRPERLVWLHATSDAHWNIIPSPMMANWPREMLTTVTFEEMDGQTKMHLTWTPHKASAAEIACFSAAADGMGKGWNAGMALLTELLAELRV